MACNENLLEASFTTIEWLLAQKSHVGTHKRGICKKCARRSVETKKCRACGESKTRLEYSSAFAWRSGSSNRKCVACNGKQAGNWTCTKCGRQTSKLNLSLWLASRKTERTTRNTQCDRCVEKSRAEVSAMCAESPDVLRRSFQNK